MKKGAFPIASRESVMPEILLCKILADGSGVIVVVLLRSRVGFKLVLKSPPRILRQPGDLVKCQLLKKAKRSCLEAGAYSEVTAKAMFFQTKCVDITLLSFDIVVFSKAMFFLQARMATCSVHTESKCHCDLQKSSVFSSM